MKNFTILLLAFTFIFPFISSASLLEEVLQNHPDCQRIKPFYIEIGNQNGPYLRRTIGGDLPVRTTVLPIASASKWIFSSYVLERLGNTLDKTVINSLTMQSGYTQFQVQDCINHNFSTVEECASFGRNGEFVSDHLGRFFYNNGHYQNLAMKLGLGPFDKDKLSKEIQNYLPIDDLSFNSIQLGGGMSLSAESFASFLQAILRQEILMGERLGSHSTCTFGDDCPQALFSPVELPDRYSLGHWIESIDGAYSSAGFFGFYPWIDRERTHYGLISRFSVDLSDGIGYGPGFTSMLCGQAIRKAIRGEHQ